MDKLLVSPAEAARLLSIGRSKVYLLMASGTLESVHIGSSRRIPVASLDRFIGSLRDDNREPDHANSARSA